MAHELSFNEAGQAEMAYALRDGACWHQLGQAMPDDADMDQWVKEAGFDWEIITSPVRYDGLGESVHQFKGQQVLFRSDTQAPLSIVSEKFKIVQPWEVVDFFRDLVAFDGMKISTMGMLFGGTKFWAMVDTGRSFKVNGDEVTGNLVLTTGVDGLSSTKVLSTSIRVVCNNTLSWATGSNTHSRSHSRTTHRQEFNPELVKQQMGLFDDNWEAFRRNVQALDGFTVKSNQARDFYFNLVRKPNLDADDQPYTVAKQVDELMAKFRKGIGNNGETAWDMVNAVTEYVDHENGKRKMMDRRVDSSLMGAGNTLKTKAFSKVLELAGL